MIKKLLLSMVVLSATAATSFAADLPSRRAPPVYIPPPIPVFTWTGFYIGGNAGYAFDANNSFATSRGATRSFVGSKSNGFTGGGQIGYNYQIGNTPIFGAIPVFGGNGGGLVIGVEADAAYTDLNSNFALGGLPYHSRTAFVGTARGRAGIAFGDLLAYGTGGFARSSGCASRRRSLLLQQRSRSARRRSTRRRRPGFPPRRCPPTRFAPCRWP